MDWLERTTYEQARQALRNVAKALRRAGVSLEDVIQTRMHVTDIDQWEEVDRAHGEVFAVRQISSSSRVSTSDSWLSLVVLSSVRISPPQALATGFLLSGSVRSGKRLTGGGSRRAHGRLTVAPLPSAFRFSVLPQPRIGRPSRRAASTLRRIPLRALA